MISLVSRKIAPSAQEAPRWTLVAVVLLVGLLVLPSLHHLVTHHLVTHHLGAHHSAESDRSFLGGSDCKVCLLLNLNFLAVIWIVIRLLVRRIVSALVPAGRALPAAPPIRFSQARSPPLPH